MNEMSWLLFGRARLAPQRLMNAFLHALPGSLVNLCSKCLTGIVTAFPVPCIYEKHRRRKGLDRSRLIL